MIFVGLLELAAAGMIIVAIAVAIVRDVRRRPDQDPPEEDRRCGTCWYGQIIYDDDDCIYMICAPTGETVSRYACCDEWKKNKQEGEEENG